MSNVKTEKLDDARLQETTALEKRTRLYTIFDFESERVTEITRTLYVSSYSEEPGAAATAMVSHAFNEVGARRLQRAHQKLVELGGNPPPLEDQAVGKSRKQPLKIS